HTPVHRLPGPGWDIIHNRTRPLEFPGLSDPRARAKRLIIAKGPARQLVYYWYQMQGRYIAEDWQKILFVGWDRATEGRTDGAIVRFTIPLRKNDDARAEAAFRHSAPPIAPPLPPYFPTSPI